MSPVTRLIMALCWFMCAVQLQFTAGLPSKLAKPPFGWGDPSAQSRDTFDAISDRTSKGGERQCLS